MVYVANEGSNTVSTIDGSTDTVMVGVIFNISPANSGHIRCDKQGDFPLNLHLCQIWH